MNYAVILCGPKGTGKSEYSKNKWKSYLLIECDIPILSKTYSLIEQSLYKSERRDVPDEELISDFINILREKDGILVDNAELIDENTLKLAVNFARSYKKELVFIFDVPYKKLYQLPIFIKLMDWDIINGNDIYGDFTAERDELKNFVSRNYFDISDDEFDKLINVTGPNFNEIKHLMHFNRSNGRSNSFLSNETIDAYLKNRFENNISSVPDILVDVLKKSSIIGEIFEKYPLEDENGFNISGISNYLVDIENLKNYIARYLTQKDTFKFISRDIYNAIVSSVSSIQKNEWHEILKNYYIQVFDGANSEYTKTDALIKAKRSALQTDDFQTAFEIEQVLLFLYLNNNDFPKALSVIDEILEYKFSAKDKTYLDYILSLKMRILIDWGEYITALEIVEQFGKDRRYRGSRDYLEYYRIYCLYNIGDIDKAYQEITELAEKIKNASKAGNDNQKLYPLVYSMLATIQNHLNLDDNGSHYYVLALNYAYNVLDNKALYYEILSKCDMFFSNDIAYSKLAECADFFESTNDKIKAAKVYFNLATEKMFNGHGTKREIERYFNIVENTFKVPDERLAYTKNNLAIYYIIEKNDFISAINELESALFVNLSEFTYMTLFLNLSMCYFKVNGCEDGKFKDAYSQFKNYEKKVESRKNRTKYEIMYRVICDLIFSEYSACDTNDICNKYLSISDLPTFFIPVLNDIKKRSVNGAVEEIYITNSAFYTKINENKIFLAEFRFWE